MDYKNCFDIPKVLDSDTLSRAKKELNENDPKQIANDIESIKEWILKQKYMNSKLDDDFILRFLRTAKYSYARTQELIKNYWTNRTEMTDQFQDRNYNEDSIMMEIADLGLYIRLPNVDKEGRIVIIQRFGLWNPDKYDINDISKYMFSSLDLICEDPRAQINGIVMLMDLTGFNAKHVSVMSPGKAQNFAKCFQVKYFEISYGLK
jgi:hypothetical protein